MTWGAAHGRAAAYGRLVASDVKPADELRPATPAETVRCDRTPDGKFAPGNGAARAKRIRSGPRGALAALIVKGDPIYQAAAKWGRRYGAHRRAELAKSHGGAISAGVGAMIESAAEMMADARFWRAKGIAECNPDFSRLAAQLIAQARGCERDAWELASRECAANSGNDEPPLNAPPAPAAPEQPMSPVLALASALGTSRALEDEDDDQ